MNQFNKMSSFGDNGGSLMNSGGLGGGSGGFPNDKINNFGLRDKYDQGAGLIQINPREVQNTVLENTLVVDTRDCIGQQSLIDSQNIFIARGGRNYANGAITNTTGDGVSPITITLTNIGDLKNGDTIIIRGVQGNTQANGRNIITGIVGSTGIISGVGNGAYLGSGTWFRPADQGFPTVNSNDDRVIDNKIIVKLDRRLRHLRSLSLYHIVIPRDIIPLTVYLADFIPASTHDYSIVYDDFAPTITNTYTTFIPQEKKYMNERMLGFYSTPLDLFRSYSFGAFSMQDQVTPPPLQLWNPPGPGAYPLQPESYPYQTVPTYKTDDFTISGESGVFHVICSGYGVYDLVDWTFSTGPYLLNYFGTLLVRKLLLLLIVQKQSYRDKESVELILSMNTVGSFLTPYPFGFGDLQRFVPGPGVGQAYQPGTSDGADPSVVTADSPIPFPEFRGNVWGPYDSPGDRFQKLGLRTVVQDLYLNGDLSNLLGSPIVVPSVPVNGITEDPIYGLNFSSLIEANLGNIDKTTNLNILNAMRIGPNGYGALAYRTDGTTGATYSNIYQSAGGQGPSNLGTPNAWVDNGVYGGSGEFSDPVAQGPLGPNITSQSADATSPGDGTGTIITHRTAFYDLGFNNGDFRNQIFNYIAYAVSDIPDTDLIIKVEEAERTERAQSTRSFNGDAILDCPIRLNLGSTSGTQQYVESLQSLIAVGNSYWEKRYLNPKATLDELHISMYSYEGDLIPLEKMLQSRRSLEFIRLFVQATVDGGISPTDFPLESFIVAFLFNPLDPRLVGRVKRYFQIIFKAHTYEGTNPGLEPTSFAGIPGSAPMITENRPWA